MIASPVDLPELDVAVEKQRVENATADLRADGLVVLIVFVSRILASFTGRILKRALKTSQLHTSGVLQEMLASLAGRAVLLLGILFGLSQLGVEIGPLLAGIGIVGFAVGFALQDTLSNFASGAMLLIYRPFDAGDMIEAGGVLGNVDHLSLVYTTLLTFDNRKIVVPNNKIWGGVITNITAMEIRRVDLTIGVAHSEKVARVEALLAEDREGPPEGPPGPGTAGQGRQARRSIDGLRRAPLGHARGLLGRALGPDPRHQAALRGGGRGACARPAPCRDGIRERAMNRQPTSTRVRSATRNGD